MEDPNIEQLKKFRKEEEPLESQQSEKKVISNPTTKHSHKKVKTNRVKRVSKVALWFLWVLLFVLCVLNE